MIKSIIVAMVVISLFFLVVANGPVPAPKVSHLDPVLNLSNSSNFINGLNITSFIGGKNVSLTFSNESGVSSGQVSINVPKYAVIASANYTIYGDNLTGNLSYTPVGSTSFPTSSCLTNHSLFTGHVLVNGVNTSETNANFTGGIYSASGSCSAAVSCGGSSLINPSPSISCPETAQASSPGASCPSFYGGGSCSSSVVYNAQGAVSGVTYSSPSPGSSITCNAGATNDCSANPSCENDNLYYTTQSATNACANTLSGSNCDLQSSCSGQSVSDSGTTSLATSCNTYGVPPASSSCAAYQSFNNPYSQTQSNFYTGQSITCPTNTYTSNAGGCSVLD